MKTLLSKPYFVISLALAGILVNGALLIGGLSLLAKVFAPAPTAEVVKPEPVPIAPGIPVESAPYAKASDPFSDAVRNATQAANLAQTAKTPTEWQNVAKFWSEAIRYMQEVPSSSTNYAIAQTKVKEYQTNFSYAQKQETKGLPELTSESNSPDQGPAYVTAEEFGDKWPFTVSNGRLGCLNTRILGNVEVSDIVFTTGGKTYALNGTAQDSGKYLDVEPIWKNNPDPFIPKVNIGPMISEGLKLCGK